MAIANNPGIVDDAVQMVSARIVLTNAQAGDVLNVGNLPAGIDDAITTVPRSDHRDPDRRGITCRLPDGDPGGDVRQHLEQPGCGQPHHRGDGERRVHEQQRRRRPRSTSCLSTMPRRRTTTACTPTITTAPFILPEWALLANDTDGEGAALDVTALSAVNAAFTASLTTNPGSVTVTDTGTAGGTLHLHGERRLWCCECDRYGQRDGHPRHDWAINGNDGDNILIGDGGNSTLDRRPGRRPGLRRGWQ